MLGNLALHHLLAAWRFTAIVAQVEQDNAGRPLGAFWEEILHNSLGVAALTVTFLDGYADELCGRAPAPANCRGAQGILDKYAAALAAHTGRRLDRDAPVVRNVDLLVRLRDAVVRAGHGRGLAGRGQDALAEQLATSFTPSVYFPGEAPLPRAWASASFAAWALRITVEFLEYIAGEAGQPSPVARLKGPLTAPPARPPVAAGQEA